MRFVSVWSWAQSPQGALLSCRQGGSDWNGDVLLTPTGSSYGKAEHVGESRISFSNECRAQFAAPSAKFLPVLPRYDSAKLKNVLMLGTSGEYA